MTTNPDAPETLRAVATDLDRHAEVLQAAASASLSRVERMIWQAPPRSDRLRALYDDRRRRADDLASHLHELADALRHDAAALDDQVAALRQIERRVRQAIDEHLATGTPLPFRTPFDPERLPGSAHPDWAKVGRLFGIR